MAISDLRGPARLRAVRFLTHPDEAAERELWLAWLDMKDASFQKLLKQKTFQGQANLLTL